MTLAHYATDTSPFDIALGTLKFWGDSGVHLTRRHVETAADMADADFGPLWDAILSPATVR